MEYEYLKAFVHLSETLHYGKTSKACNMSPSTLSRVIQRFEATVGKQLFERDNRSVQLTDAGLAFQHYAKDALARWETFQDTLASKATVLRGEISMCCTITASYGVLPDILVQFRKSYPQVNIKLLTGDSQSAIQKVTAGEADFAVAAMPDKIPARLAFQPITEIYLRFVGPTIPWPFQDKVRTKNIPWEEVPLIVAAKGMARTRIDTWFRSKKITPYIYAQVTGNESILALVNLGFGLGIVPQLVFETNMLRDVEVLDVRPEILPYRVGICTQKRRMNNPLIRAFWNIL